MRGSLTRLALSAVVALASSGCSVAFVKGPPGESAPVATGNCTTGWILPGLDVVAAGIGVRGAIVAESDMVADRGQKQAFSAAWAVAFAASRGRGLRPGSAVQEGGRGASGVKRVAVTALACVVLPAGPVRGQLALRPGAGTPVVESGAPLQAAVDSTRLFGHTDAILAGGLLAGQIVLFALDDEIQAEARRMKSGSTDDVAAVFQPLGRSAVWYATSASAFALGKVTGQERVADVGLHAFASLAVANAVTSTLKGVAGRWRPRITDVVGADRVFVFHDSDGWGFFAGVGEGGRRQSYPSGHATAAFTIATVLAEELGGPTPFLVYPVATGVAWSRVNDDVHWSSDVVMGALVGIFAGRLVVRYGHRRRGWLERTLLLEPAPDGGGIAVGLRLGA